MAEEVMERFARREQQINELRRRHVKQHYRQLGEANKNGTKVAWSMAGLAPSLLDALGIMACSPENYCVIASAKQMADKFCTAAESRGIPHDTCSYGRCMVGMMYQKDGPYGPLPRPDFVFVNPGTCDAHAVMWQIPAQRFGAPVSPIDGPHFLNGRITERDIEYRVAQLHRVVAFCEEHLGCKFDLDRFKENTLREHKVRSLLNEIQTLRKRIPCPRSTRHMISEIFYSPLSRTQRKPWSI